MPETKSEGILNCVYMPKEIFEDAESYQSEGGGYQRVYELVMEISSDFPSEYQGFRLRHLQTEDGLTTDISDKIVDCRARIDNLEGEWDKEKAHQLVAMTKVFPPHIRDGKDRKQIGPMEDVSLTYPVDRKDQTNLHETIVEVKLTYPNATTLRQILDAFGKRFVFRAASRNEPLLFNLLNAKKGIEPAKETLKKLYGTGKRVEMALMERLYIHKVEYRID